MSVQFGECNFDGQPVDPKDLDRVRPALEPYGPDGEGYICKDDFGIIYRAFHTTKESRRETQPYVSVSGFVLTWDGRLDNREELIGELTAEVSHESTDLEIVATGYERWGVDAFRKLVGDWALSIWTPRNRSLILAKDFVGTRHLYYAIDKHQVTWCTILDPLVLFAKRRLVLCEEYLAGWLSFFPAAHLTPYLGISAVPPSHFVLLRAAKQTVSKYWDFDSRKQIYYRTDQEYEEHFRSVFAEAVRRRLRSDSPVLAELSGGMDSSSIVCMADTVIADGTAETPRLDTVSYYDDSEPNWNERPYFAKVEERRGRVGCHVDIAAQPSRRSEFSSKEFAATPASLVQPSEAASQMAKYITLRRNRAVLSGIGGDEVMGGVPTPLPELEDLLAKGRFIDLSHRLKVWALIERRPWLHLFWTVIRAFLPTALVRTSKLERPAPWLQSEFVKRNRRALLGYRTRLKPIGALPSFQENLSTLDGLRRQLGCIALGSAPICERRYPYLDRPMLEFMYALPRTQVVRPGRRRSLMRRALVGIVPDEILSRKRKAFAVRSPWAAVAKDWADMNGQLTSGILGFVDPDRVAAAIGAAHQSKEIPLVLMMRTMSLEFWVRRLSGFLDLPTDDFTAARRGCPGGSEPSPVSFS